MPISFQCRSVAAQLESPTILQAGATISGIFMRLYWTRVREHFLHGCALPGIIVSIENQLVAFCTDLTTGDGNCPAVRILRQPIHSMCDGDPTPDRRTASTLVEDAGIFRSAKPRLCSRWWPVD